MDCSKTVTGSKPRSLSFSSSMRINSDARSVRGLRIFFRISAKHNQVPTGTIGGSDSSWRFNGGSVPTAIGTVCSDLVGTVCSDFRNSGFVDCSDGRNSPGKKYRLDFPSLRSIRSVPLVSIPLMRSMKRLVDVRDCAAALRTPGQAQS